MGFALFAVIFVIVLIASAVGGHHHDHRRGLTGAERSHAITPAQFASIRDGWTSAEIIDSTGKQPEDRAALKAASAIDDPFSAFSCMYYNRVGGKFGDTYRLCFNLRHRLYDKTKR